MISIGLSAFQLAPSLFERKYLKFDDQLLIAYPGHFKSIFQLLRIPAEEVNIGTRFQVGISHTLVTLASLILLLKTKKSEIRKFLFFFITVALLALFLVTPQSKFLWDLLLPLKFTLYPWRFLGVVAFASASIASLLIKSTQGLKLPITAALIFLAIFSNRHYIKVDQFIPAQIPEKSIQGNGTTQDEFDPVGFNHKAVAFAQPPLEELDQPIVISNFHQQPNKWSFTTESPQSGQLKLGLLYFPGWVANLDGREVAINTGVFVDEEGREKDLRGLIVLNVPKGTHSIEVKFRETSTRRLGNLITLLTFTFMIIKLNLIPAKLKKKLTN